MPPGNALPVEVIAGQATKYSYARLAGEATSLRLRAITDDGAELNPAQARVQLCQITSNWTPSRGTPCSDAPTYGDVCVAGVAKNDVWSFNLARTNALTTNGWAIVPVLDGNATFRVTFAGATLSYLSSWINLRRCLRRRQRPSRRAPPTRPTAHRASSPEWRVLRHHGATRHVAAATAVSAASVPAATAGRSTAPITSVQRGAVLPPTHFNPHATE